MCERLLRNLTLVALLMLALVPQPAWAQIVVQSTGVSPGASTADCVITKPTGTAEGDLLLAGCEMVATVTWTPASGFTVAGSHCASGMCIEVWWKIADAGDVAASTFTFTASTTATNLGAMLRITGHDPTTPIDVTPVECDGSSSTAVFVCTSAITPTVANTLLVMMTGWVDNAGAGDSYYITNDNPSWTEHADLLTGAGSDSSFAAASGTKALAASSGDWGMNTNNAGNQSFRSILAAIRPAAVGGAVPKMTLLGVGDTQ